MQILAPGVVGTNPSETVPSILKPRKLPLLSTASYGKRKKYFGRAFFSSFRDKWKESTEVSKFPEAEQYVLTQLDGIEDADGVLTIDNDFDAVLLCSLLAHPKANNVREIRLKNWNTENYIKFKDSCAEKIKKFNETFKTQPPEDLIYLQFFYQEVNALLHRNAFGEAAVVYACGFETIGGLFGDLFSKDQIFFDDWKYFRSHHQELSYLETFWYGSDGVSYGFVFDYQLNQFAELAYDAEAYVCCGPLWDQFTEKLVTFANESIEHIDYSNEIPVEQSDLYETCCLPWLYSMLANGYINCFQIKKHKFTGKNLLRYQLDLSDEDRQNLSDDGKYYLTRTYPICLLEKNKILGELDPGKPYFMLRLYEFLDELSDAFDFECSLNISVARLLAYLIRSNQIAFLKYGGFLTRFEFNADGHVDDYVIAGVLESLVRVAERRMVDGAYGFAFLLGLLLWNHGSKITTEFSVRLLSELPDNVIHPLLKSSALNYGKVRFCKR